MACCENEIRKQAQIEANKAKAKENYNKALDLYGKGQIDAAMLFLRSDMDDSYAKNASSWVDKGRTAFKSNNFTKALNDYRMAIALDPNVADANEGIIRIYLNDNQTEKLKLFYAEVLKHYPNSKALQTSVPDVFYKEAMLHKQDSDFELAIDKLEVITFLNRNYKDAASRIQICKNEIEKQKMAKQNAQKAIDAYKTPRMACSANASMSRPLPSLKR